MTRNRVQKQHTVGLSGLHINTDDFALDGIFIQSNARVQRSPIPLRHKVSTSNPSYNNAVAAQPQTKKGKSKIKQNQRRTTSKQNHSEPMQYQRQPQNQGGFNGYGQPGGFDTGSSFGHTNSMNNAAMPPANQKSGWSLWSCLTCSAQDVDQPHDFYQNPVSSTQSYEYYNAMQHGNNVEHQQQLNQAVQGYALHSPSDNHSNAAAVEPPEYSRARKVTGSSFAPIPEDNASEYSDATVQRRVPSYSLRASFDIRGPPPRPTSMSTFVGKLSDPVKSAYHRVSGRQFTPVRPMSRQSNASARSRGGSFDEIDVNSAAAQPRSRSSTQDSGKRRVRKSVRDYFRRQPPPRPESRGVRGQYAPAPPSVPRGIMSQTLLELRTASDKVMAAAANGVTPHVLEELAQMIDVAKARGIKANNRELRHAIQLESRMRAQLIAQRSIQQAIEKEDFAMLKRVLKRAKKEGVMIEIRFDKQEDREKARKSFRRSYVRSMRVPFVV